MVQGEKKYITVSKNSVKFQNSDIIIIQNTVMCQLLNKWAFEEDITDRFIL